MSRSPSGSSWAAALLLPVALSACFLVRRVSVVEVDRASDSVHVRSPVKAHLIDGSTVVYRSGVLVARGRLIGGGTRYGLALADSSLVSDLAIDSVAGVESFRTHIDGGATVMVSTLATVGALFGTAGLAAAIFGSCPTYYSDSAGTEVMEAEGFSYSISPLFETRDVDRLRARPRADGTFVLDIRNEALETHFINHIELIEARHGGNEFVAPDPAGHLVAASLLHDVRRARDRAGRDIRASLSDADGDTYATDSSVLRSASEHDLRDEIELAFDAPASDDSVALVLRLRNSLLNTVLLYDIMLGDPGARSLDWQANELSRVSTALEMATWYSSKMGMAISTWRDGKWELAARLRDTGPLAWKDVIVPLERARSNEVRVLLQFPADNWRIDRARLALSMRRPESRRIPLARVSSHDDSVESNATKSLAEPDNRYLETQAGQSFRAAWDVGPDRADTARTFFLASQGYYTEWVRQGWLRAGRDTATFTPNDRSLARAIRRWRETKQELEPRFFATKVPVR